MPWKHPENSAFHLPTRQEVLIIIVSLIIGMIVIDSSPCVLNQFSLFPLILLPTDGVKKLTFCIFWNNIYGTGA